ncbi:MAG: Ig-like domain-containing protein, partial [Nocardioides sp.]
MTSRRAERRLPQVVGRPSRRLLLVLLVVLSTAGTTWFSGASFTSASNTSVPVTAAADYYPPKVALQSPGAVITGTVQVTATSTDSASAITMVRIERAPLGSTTWTELCTDTVAPYACSWDTTTVTDGDYQLRATSTDAAGFSATSTVLTTRVANAAEVILSDVAPSVRG